MLPVPVCSGLALLPGRALSPTRGRLSELMPSVGIWHSWAHAGGRREGGELLPASLPSLLITTAVPL